MLHLELWCCVTKTETGFPSTECKPLHWTLINWCRFLRTVPRGDILPASNWFLVWDHQVYPVKMGKPATAFRDLKHPCSHLSVRGPLCSVCLRAHKCVPWGLALLLCMRVRGPRLKLWQLVTPRIQATPTSTTFLRAEFRGLDGHGEIRGVRRRKEEWTQPKEGEENIKEKQTERRWGGGGDTAHAFHNRQKLLLIHSGLATTGKGQPPHTVWLRAGCCLA